MNIKKKIILSILGVSLSWQLAFAQGNGDAGVYNKAYSEITNMLEGRTPLSVRRAVFLAEWAYLDGNLDYERDFCEPIRKGADYLRRMIVANQWEKYKTAKQIALCNFFFYPCSGNGQNPFLYDFSREYPEYDWHYQLVSRTIKTHKGQCHSLPWTFKLSCNHFIFFTIVQIQKKRRAETVTRSTY
ncbi:MAG: hypothetical protein J6M59_08770 [Bacteroidaceae bacterium]|nr:hypothetical protein [Bacteroidaceae bacterium]MBP3245179.1 hypothetical protein [Bacteroidaceae bacterium]